MIKEIRIKNFLSFRDEVTFSFEATEDQGLEHSYIVEVAPNVRLLRFAMVYGANASGKSNLLLAFEFLRNFWFSQKKTIEESTDVVPFAFDEKVAQAPSEFRLTFYIDQKPYEYLLVLDDDRVYTEQLSFNRTNRPTLIFKRELQNDTSVVYFNPEEARLKKIEQEQIALKSLPNMSLFAALMQLNLKLPPHLLLVRDYFRNQFMPVVTEHSILNRYVTGRLTEKKQRLAELAAFVQRADFNIAQLTLKEEKEKIPEELLQILQKDPDIEAAQLSSETEMSSYKLDFVHEIRKGDEIKKYHLPASLQSAGTLRLIDLETLILDLIESNAFLCVDEIEQSLHPELVEFLIANFLRQSHQAQLLVTTHNVNLLRAVDSLIRRDAVWFTEKEASGATRVYSLVEFKELEKLKSFQTAYLQGLFGAIPDIKD